VSGVVSGILIALAAAWIWHGYGRLWRHSIATDAAEALDMAAALGMRVRPSSRRCAWIAEGALDGVPVRIVWAGGVFGERTLVDIGGLCSRTSLVCSEAQLHSMLRSAPAP